MIAFAGPATLFRIDCRMSPGVDDSRASLLRVRFEDGCEVAEALTSDGRARELLRAC